MSIDTDVVIVGAGPCGLFQVFELGLLGIESHVVESLPEIGGQCAVLYPEKPIYDIPALPVVGAQELVDRLRQQLEPFDPKFHLGEQVARLEPRDDGTFHLATDLGTAFTARAVVIAAGVGAFAARPLRTPGAAAHEGRNLHYRVGDKTAFAGKRVVILGGGDSALDWALELHAAARSITVVHRRDEFRAAPASVARMRELAAEDPERLRIVVGRITGIEEQAGRLSGIGVASFDDPDHRETIALDELLVFYGLSPSLGPIAEWGLDIDKRLIQVDTATYQTNIPGVFAIGDISTYPGKKKLILSGFHEAAMAAYAVQKYLNPEIKQRVQYTTTSSELQTRLGVKEAAKS